MSKYKTKTLSRYGLGADSDALLVRTLLRDLAADAGVQALFGTPARIFDDETRTGIYPFAMLERHERFDAGAAMVDGAEHRVTIATLSRHGGRSEARHLLGALRAAIDRLNMQFDNQRIVLAHTVYSDVMRTPDRQHFRGILRIRIITEEA